LSNELLNRASLNIKLTLDPNYGTRPSSSSYTWSSTPPCPKQKSPSLPGTPNNLHNSQSYPPTQPTMARPALILGVVALLLVSCALGSSVDMPFILAHKKASLTRLKSGAERVSVSIDIYNQGSSYVYSQSILQSPI